MSPQPETLVTPDMYEHLDCWSSPEVSSAVAESDIRKWAIAVYWPETPPPLYWDQEYAKTTRYGGIVAPVDFNPFAWPVQRTSAQDNEQPPLGGTIGTRVMNGGSTEQYLIPMHPGDVITSSSALVDWNERQTRLGLTLFTISETRWTNQTGELVKIKSFTLIRY